MSIADKVLRAREDYDAVYNAGVAAGQAQGNYGEGYEDGYSKGEADGYEKGHAAGQTEGYTDGRQAEHDRFWDAYFDNWNPKDGSNLFGGLGWNDQTFNPPRSITVNNVYMMFRSCAITDLGAKLKEAGVIITIDTYMMQHTFSSTRLTNIGNIVFTTPFPSLDTSFAYSTYLRVIEPVIPVTDCNIGYGFASCTALEEVRFDGTIAKMAYFANSPKLSAESVQSIIDALKDLTGQASEKVTFHADVGAKLTEVQKATVTAKNWTLVY